MKDLILNIEEDGRSLAEPDVLSHSFEPPLVALAGR